MFNINITGILYVYLSYRSEYILLSSRFYLVDVISEVEAMCVSVLPTASGCSFRFVCGPSVWCFQDMTQ